MLTRTSKTDDDWVMESLEYISESSRNSIAPNRTGMVARLSHERFCDRSHIRKVALNKKYSTTFLASKTFRKFNFRHFHVSDGAASSRQKTEIFKSGHGFQKRSTFIALFFPIFCERAKKPPFLPFTTAASAAAIKMVLEFTIITQLYYQFSIELSKVLSITYYIAINYYKVKL